MKNKKLRALKEFYEINSLDYEGYGFDYVKDLNLKDLENLDSGLLELGEIYNYIASSIIDLYRELGKVKYCEYKVSDYFLSNDNVEDAIKILDPYGRYADIKHKAKGYELLKQFAFLEEYENVTKEFEWFDECITDNAIQSNDGQEYIDITGISKEGLEEELSNYYDTKEEIKAILNDCGF